jgi:hypothetical protein
MVRARSEGAEWTGEEKMKIWRERKIRKKYETEKKKEPSARYKVRNKIKNKKYGIRKYG